MDSTEQMYQRLNQKALAKRQGLILPKRQPKIPTAEFPLSEWITTTKLAEVLGMSDRSIHQRLEHREDVERRKIKR